MKQPQPIRRSAQFFPLPIFRHDTVMIVLLKSLANASATMAEYRE
jgi:hypothetical protein